MKDNGVSEDQAVDIEIVDQVLIATMNRSDWLNALTSEVMAGLDAALDRAIDDDIKVHVIAARGRAFCAGGDMASLAIEDDDAARRYIGELTEYLLRLRLFPKPVVAAVQGYAVGGGAEIALESDLLVAAHDLILRQPDVAIGSTPATAYRLVQIFGPMIAARCVLAGADITGSALLDHGVVDRLHEPDEVRDAALVLALELASRNARSLTSAKQALRLPFTADLAADLRVNLQSQLSCYWNPEQRQAVADFLDRTADRS